MDEKQFMNDAERWELAFRDLLNGFEFAEMSFPLKDKDVIGKYFVELLLETFNRPQLEDNYSQQRIHSNGETFNPSLLKRFYRNIVLMSSNGETKIFIKRKRNTRVGEIHVEITSSGQKDSTLKTNAFCYVAGKHYYLDLHWKNTFNSPHYDVHIEMDYE